MKLRHYDYMPFGDTLITSARKYNTFSGYESLERDPESSYMNYGARLYDPQTGRFLSVDPLPHAWVWQAFRSLTPYQYAYNSPLSYKDPTGLAPQKEGGDKIMNYSGDQDLKMGIFKNIQVFGIIYQLGK